ncbi:MAG: hypothetical protein MRY83_02185, partial [Flavobacteriales bacterium]|nr:hypothetical protein [Flavobacteriales bacterium]
MIRTTLTTIFVFLSVFIIQAQTNCFIDLQAYGFPETTAGANDGSAISIVSSTYDLDNFDS